MLAYLVNGWFTQVGPQKLRAEVIDGALDSAAHLHQAGCAAATLRHLALRLRTLAWLLARPMAHGGPPLASKGSLGQAQREIVRAHVQEATDEDAALQAWALDGLETVGHVRELRALVLHVFHVAHVIGLLETAHRQRPIRRPAAPAQTTASVGWQAPR